VKMAQELLIHPNSRITMTSTQAVCDKHIQVGDRRRVCLMRAMVNSLSHKTVAFCKGVFVTSGLP